MCDKSKKRFVLFLSVMILRTFNLGERLSVELFICEMFGFARIRRRKIVENNLSLKRLDILKLFLRNPYRKRRKRLIIILF